MLDKGLYFVSGIDTDTGKSYACGYLAKLLQQQGYSVITQKFIQTGNSDISEDIVIHRKIMQHDLLAEDKEKLTMPQIFSYPCSPHLAAKIDNCFIDYDKIKDSAAKLLQNYDIVLQEGAGGLMVPLSYDYLTIDYIKNNKLPLIFVTSSKLGSINHTLLSFEAIKKREIKLACVIYNEYCNNIDEIIKEDTFNYIKTVTNKMFPHAVFISMPKIELN